MFYPTIGAFLGACIGGLIWGVIGAAVCATICVIAMISVKSNNKDQVKQPLNTSNPDNNFITDIKAEVSKPSDGRSNHFKRFIDPERRKHLASLDDFDRWVFILSEDLKHLHKFDLFETRAALLWNEESKYVAIICINRFTRGAPDDGSRYDHFSYNIHDWYWDGFQPRGCADNIKKVLKELFKGVKS